MRLVKAVGENEEEEELKKEGRKDEGGSNDDDGNDEVKSEFLKVFSVLFDVCLSISTQCLALLSL